MATLGELRTQLRDQRIVEGSTDYYTDDILLDMLAAESREIAGAFRFPKDTRTVSVSDGATSVSVPTGTRDVESVLFDGVAFAKFPDHRVRFWQALPQEPWPRGWYWNHAQGGDLIVGPSMPDGEITMLYLPPVYSGTPTASTEVWGGLYEDWHELVVLKAAVRAFEMGIEFEDSAYYIQRYQQVMTEFAQFLGIPMGGEAE